MTRGWPWIEEDITPEMITWQRVQPPIWKRHEDDINYIDEDGELKSKARLEREERQFQSAQDAHRSNLAVIMRVLNIPQPTAGWWSEEFAPSPFAGEEGEGETTMKKKQSKEFFEQLDSGDLDALSVRKTTAERPTPGFGGGEGFLGMNGGSPRLFALRVVIHPYFEFVVLLAIMASSVLLAMETHTWPVPGSETEFWFKLVDIFFTVCFTCEMLAKMYAFGLYKSRGAYLRSYFNLLDVMVVFSSLFTMAMGGGGALRSLRLLRALRPLRSIHRLPKLRLVINAVMASIPAIWHVCILGICLGIVLSIMGMELFQGKLWYCTWLPEEAEPQPVHSFARRRMLYSTCEAFFYTSERYKHDTFILFYVNFFTSGERRPR